MKEQDSEPLPAYVLGQKVSYARGPDFGVTSRIVPGLSLCFEHHSKLQFRTGVVVPTNFWRI